jgi:methionine-rich copper-binding protein CopC
MTKESSQMRSGITVIFVLFSILCLLPETSMGHAFPDHADPKVGATVPSSPSLVRIWFDAALEPAFSKLVVQDTSGRKVDKGNGGVNSSDPTLLEAGVSPLPAGIYRVIWDVVARDGHRTTGDYTFVIK